MYLEKIKDPKDLKKLTTMELTILAAEIRHFLITSLSKTGGHLSSNLGIVELTIALHKIFDSPNDKLIFDVGHQSYVHKILTGRKDKFNSLRQYQGLSGFIKRSESIHDIWEAGHAGTSISAAMGIACANTLLQKDDHVIAIIGDASITNGMSLEALNHLGDISQRLIIILNDNEMSISKNVGAISTNFSKLRSSKSYLSFKKELRKDLHNSNFGASLFEALRQLKEHIKNGILPDTLFSALGIKYIGPIDGHNIKLMTSVFEGIKQINAPVVVHVATQKGKGYLPSEEDEKGNWHGVSCFDWKTGKSIKKENNLVTYSEYVANTILRLQKDKMIAVITPAMTNGSKLNENALQYPKQFYDVGIAEEHALTFAAGLAIEKVRSFVSIYSTFLQRAIDQLSHDIARMKLPVVIGIDRAGLVGEDGDTHQGIYDVSLLLTIPNLIVTQGKNAIETANLLYTGFCQESPFTVRYSKKNVALVNEEFKKIPIGKWEFLQCKNHKCCVISYGDLVSELIGNQFDVVNARFLKPMDYELLQYIANQYQHIVVAHQDSKSGNLAMYILDYLSQLDYQGKFSHIGIDDQFVEHGKVDILLESMNLTPNQIVERIYKLCD